MCLDATCRQAHALGYEVILVKDAHSTFDSGDLTASQIIAQTNAALGELVKVQAASRLTFG